MSPEDVEDAADSVVIWGQLDGRTVDPIFRDMLIRVAAGELSADEVMKILRKERDNGER